MDSFTFLKDLGLALLMGGLIGLERERNHHGNGTHDFGGIRTMSLIAVFGYLVQVFFGDSLVLFAVFTGGFLLLIAMSYIASAIITKTTGATTESASFFVYLAGILMGKGLLLEAAFITLVVVLLLYFKESLHTFAHKVEKEELYDTLKFIAITFVILPLLPNETFGPLSVLNPYSIWLMVVLISSISFVSYIAVKLLGSKHGIGLSGFLGGLVSSTALTLSFSAMSKKASAGAYAFIFGIMIASSAMSFRVIAEVFFINMELLNMLWIPMVAMGVTGLLLGLFFWFKKGRGNQSVHPSELGLKSPFKLGSATQFGLLFAALLFISKYMSVSFGDQGLYITALISGFVDVGAMTISMANLSKSQDLPLSVAAIAITITAISNTFTKGIIVLLFASKTVGRNVFAAICVTILVGLGTILIVVPQAYGIN